MVYKNINKVKMTRKEFDRVQDFLKVDFDDESEEMQKFIDNIGAITDDYIPLFTFKFKNGDRITINLNSGNSNYYDSSYLWNKDDDEIEWEFDCGFGIDEEMKFDTEEDTYICKIDIID